MKKIFQTKTLVIFIVLLYFVLVKCNVKAKSVCSLEKQNNNIENIYPVERASSEIFPSRDLIIKI
jgi:hypothetical protein